MSLRSSAGATRGPIAPGLPPTRGFSPPASTWPTRPARLPPTSRGSRILALETVYRPLTERDRAQIRAGRELPPYEEGRPPIVRRVVARTAARTFRPVLNPDRGWRQTYYIPSIGGAGGSSDDQGGNGGSSDSGKGCC